MIKLGIIGFSKGNGHPYSWSAIINGYSSFEMEKCEFPVIFNYLSEQKYPQHFIKNAKVTHIWTQERTISEKISKASKIKYIVENIDDMIGLVDGVLLARDDAENHIKYAENFIKNGIPIYIDKPLSLSLKGAEKIFSFEKFPGQIFSCSALKFSTEMMLDENDINNLGKICHIRGTVPNSWDKYIIHVVDPIIENIDPQWSIVESHRFLYKDKTLLYVVLSSGVTLVLESLGECKSQIQIEFFGESGSTVKVFSDSFSAFKKALEEFIRQIIQKDLKSNKERILKSIAIVELGSNVR